MSDVYGNTFHSHTYGERQDVYAATHTIGYGVSYDPHPNPWAHPELLSLADRAVYDKVALEMRMAGRVADGLRHERQAAEDERDIGRMADAHLWKEWRPF